MTKRYLMSVTAHNLGRILRKMFGVGKPKALQGDRGLAALAQLAIQALGALLRRLENAYAPRKQSLRPCQAA